MKGLASIFIRLISHNIRYATDKPFEGELPWEDRKPLLINELIFSTLHSPESFICLQEVLNDQLTGIMDGLNFNTRDEWAYIGVGRDDGKTAGEYSPIIYRPSVWNLEKFDTIWLSETPDRPSKGWDAASIRILTVGEFQHRRSKQKILGMSTHLDDQGVKAREESAKLILDSIAEFTSASTSENGEALPVFLAGDLNSDPNDEAFKTLNGTDSPLRDVKDLANIQYGHKFTFTGFDGKTELTEIDHIFVGPKRQEIWDVKSYAVLENRFDDGVYNSDHRAVVSDCGIVGNEGGERFLHQDAV